MNVSVTDCDKTDEMHEVDSADMYRNERLMIFREKYRGGRVMATADEGECCEPTIGWTNLNLYR